METDRITPGQTANETTPAASDLSQVKRRNATQSRAWRFGAA